METETIRFQWQDGTSWETKVPRIAIEGRRSPARDQAVRLRELLAVQLLVASKVLGLPTAEVLKRARALRF